MTLRPISTELAIVAKDELNEEPTQLNSQLEVVKRSFNSQRTLSGQPSDQILLSFLRGCKFSLEKTKEKLLLFYRIRTALPQVVQDRDPLNEHVLKVIRMGVGIPLPETVSQSDPRIFVIRVAKFDLAECNFADVIKVGTMINDIMMRDDDQVVICGMSLIIDLAHVTAGHLFQFDLDFLKQVAVLYQDASPFRMRGIHIFNPPPGMETVVKVFNGLLSSKNQDRRIFVHGSGLDSLHAHFPRHVLPVEYGGTLESIQKYVDFWENKLKKERNYLIELTKLQDNQIGEADSLQANKSCFSVLPKNNECFGIEGSFRKLELD
ncbi:alpha-tocopherol transfer protein-like [Wyeomyia smithii]|uniref:alpha-tocopherol transfer protein-like n=1 Tax=Wyeomyia smithii TaxID=174621 RepID=UPI002467B8C8|nr:alpha-tocopherol transfer protein-like [Wyeomyia smithii]